MLRDIRMKLGLPASRDVEILSKMIKKLHAAAESFVSEPVPVAKASIPDFARALYGEDIYTKLSTIYSSLTYSFVHEILGTLCILRTEPMQRMTTAFFLVILSPTYVGSQLLLLQATS